MCLVGLEGSVVLSVIRFTTESGYFAWGLVNPARFQVIFAYQPTVEVGRS